MTSRSYKITAATISPRRIKLLSRIFSNIIFCASDYREKKIKYFFPPVLLSLIHAWHKTRQSRSNNGLVLGFDTIVYRGCCLFNKPGDGSEARTMISKLNGRTHKVVTGAVVRYKGRIRFFYSVSRVRFKRLSEKQITDYIASGSWKTKAGAYGIQDKGRDLVEKYTGDYYNIVGLPLNALMKILNTIDKN